MDLARKLRWAFGVSLVSAVVAPLVLGHWTPMIGFGLLLAVWISSTAVLNLVSRIASHPAIGWARRFSSQPGSYYGMLLAHLGVSVFVLGVTVVSGFQSESDVRMATGESTTTGGYTFTLQGVREIKGPNYVAAQASIVVTQGDKPVATLWPERRIYTVTRSAMTEVAELDEARTTVVSCGSDTEPLPGTRPAAAPDAPFVLVLSATFTHKNRGQAIAAFADAVQRHGIEGNLLVAPAWCSHSARTWPVVSCTSAKCPTRRSGGCYATHRRCCTPARWKGSG